MFLLLISVRFSVTSVVRWWILGKARYLTVCLLLLAASLYITFHSDILVPMNRHFDEFPVTVKSWRMVSQSELDEQTLDILKPTDYLLRTYEGNGGMVQLYIGYHGGGQDSGEIHSPRHCLPGSGWCEVSGGRIQLDIGGKKIELTKALYEKGGARICFIIGIRRAITPFGMSFH